MRLILQFKDILQKMSGNLVSELEQMVERINSWARVEHNGDGTHGHITADSITVETFAYGGDTQTTIGAAGGASALPATPLGYFLVTLSNGTEVAVPYYTKA